MARPEGFEPPTAWFVARYSIRLSYGRVWVGILSDSTVGVKRVYGHPWPHTPQIDYLEATSPSGEW